MQALILCTSCKFSKFSQGSFSFSIRGFPATVRGAVPLVTALKLLTSPFPGLPPG